MEAKQDELTLFFSQKVAQLTEKLKASEEYCKLVKGHFEAGLLQSQESISPERGQ